MDSIGAFMRGEAARRAGSRSKVFDWDKAAQILIERVPDEADAGLQSDMSWTGGTIWRDGRPHLDDYTYLASIWAAPILVLDGEEIPCWKYAEDTPGWNADTKWPESALDIVRNKGVTP